jgi:O-antigen/teichoic acid export membrane protein
MTLKAQVAHGLKWQTITIIGQRLLSLVVFTTLARLLQPSAFGLIGLVGVYLTFVGMFADQGIGQALVQRHDLEPEHMDAAFWFNNGCALLLCLGTIALAGPVARMFHEPRLAPLLRWSSLGLVINATSAIHGTLFVKAMDFRRPAIRTLIANFAGGAVGVGLALAGCGVWALVGQQLVSALAGAVFLWTASSYRPSARFSLAHLRHLFDVSSSILATSFLWFFSSRLDQIVIGRFAGVPALGLYVISGKVPELANTITQQPMAEVSLPALARLQNDHRKMQNAIYRGMELNATVSFVVFVGIAAVAPDFVPLFFGAKWAAAAPLCSLLSLYALVNALQVFFHPSLLASGGAGNYVFLNVWHAVGVLAACVIGIQFGVTYLVLGLIVNGLIVAVPALLFLRARIGLSPLGYCKPCLVPAAASLFMAVMIWAAAWVLPSNITPLLRLACKVSVGGTAYLGFILLFAPAALRQLVETFGHAFGHPRILPAASPST